MTKCYLILAQIGSATGFAMGIERLMLALDKQNNIDEIASDENQKDIYVAYTSDKLNDAIALVNELRAEGKVRISFNKSN